MTITGATTCYPLLGHPVGQVRTPPAINAFFARLELDAVMFPFDVDPAGIDAFFLTFRHWTNCGGCSITVPHKQAAFRSADQCSARAHTIGAANIMRRLGDGTLIADMTDGIAFVEGLRRKNAGIAGKTALVAGAAGGAGSAIVLALCDAGASHVCLVDTNPERLSRLEVILRQRGHAFEALKTKHDIPAVDIAVNATPLGMAVGDALPFDPDVLPAHAVVADVVTKPEITPLLAKARDRDLMISTGFDMADAQLEFQMRHLGLWPNGDSREARKTTS